MSMAVQHAFFLLYCVAAVAQADYTSCRQLSSTDYGDFRLYWTLSQALLRAKVSSSRPDLGWISVGFGGSAGMNGSDVVV
eukprot:gene2228-3113_t